MALCVPSDLIDIGQSRYDRYISKMKNRLIYNYDTPVFTGTKFFYPRNTEQGENKNMKMKQRGSDKLVITYANGKQYTIKNLNTKPYISEDTIIVEYDEKESVDGVVFDRKIKVTIPTSDVTLLSVLPKHKKAFVDTTLTFVDGKIVNIEDKSDDCKNKSRFLVLY